MWLLMRGNSFRADPDGGLTLAASPDTADRPVPWRWSVRLVAGEVAVQVAPGAARCKVSEHGDEPLALQRAAGEVLVVVARHGDHELAHGAGPWQRVLAAGDVAVIEGEDAEPLRLRPITGGARLTLVRLTSPAGSPLRWDP